MPHYHRRNPVSILTREAGGAAVQGIYNAWSKGMGASMEQSSQRMARNYQDEAARVANFYRHKEILTSFSELDYDEINRQLTALPVFKDPISTFSNETSQKGLPQINDDNVFSIILKHRKLTDQHKINVLTYLISREDYRRYQFKLFISPIIDKLLANSDFSPMVLNAYQNHLSSGENTLSIKAENYLWNELISKEVVNHTALVKQVKDNLGHPKRAISLAMLCIRAANSQEEVMDSYRKMSDLTIKHKPLPSRVSNIIKKIAKQRLLELALKDANAVGDNLPHKINESADAVNLLSEHRSWWIFTFFRSTKSTEIYKMIKNKSEKSEAIEEFGKEEEKLSQLILSQG